MLRSLFHGCGALALCVLIGCKTNTSRLDWLPESVREVYRPPGGDFYSYAPSVVRLKGVDHILACHNAESGVIRDDIYFIRRTANNVTAESVFKSGPDCAWDSFHVCDPSIVSGKFKFDGKGYRYAMFYLGNNVDASRNNQVGVAFGNDWRGPWMRYPEPIVEYPQNGRWGAGQPSAVYDSKGKLLLFYTKGIPATAGYVREVDLHDMASPKIGPEFKVSTNGLLRASGAPDYWNNFDVAYDPARKRFWAIREKRPYAPEDPRYITSHLEVVSVQADQIFRPDAQWRAEGEINPELTGHARNHNACFDRTLAGALPQRNRIRIVFSTSCAGEECRGKRPLWSYSLWQVEGKMVDGPVLKRRSPARKEVTHY
ncbi:MAG: hypothetical protein H0X66_12775 [Verrucomicrobia bacterium]|nr:hypothetical protein [Verrucomicrobiota bacterium]